MVCISDNLAGNCKNLETLVIESYIIMPASIEILFDKPIFLLKFLFLL